MDIKLNMGNAYKLRHKEHFEKGRSLNEGDIFKGNKEEVIEITNEFTPRRFNSKKAKKIFNDEAEKQCKSFCSKFVNIIYSTRKDKGLSQADLSFLCGVEQGYISKIERFHFDAHLHKFTRILYFLGYKLDVFTIKERE